MFLLPSSFIPLWIASYQPIFLFGFLMTVADSSKRKNNLRFSSIETRLAKGVVRKVSLGQLDAPFIWIRIRLISPHVDKPHFSSLSKWRKKNKRENLCLRSYAMPLTHRRLNHRRTQDSSDRSCVRERLQPNGMWIVSCVSFMWRVFKILLCTILETAIKIEISRLKTGKTIKWKVTVRLNLRYQQS